MKKKRTWRYLLVTVVMILALVYWFPGRVDHFDLPRSTVVLDAGGGLLGARIAGDGQWRFPASDTVPARFATALIEFEDRQFYRHPGINPFSIIRAVYQNIRNRRIVSGGSTISMQVIRLSRQGHSRTVPEKLLEMVLALKLELRHSKEEVLTLYASNAPFGGNVVGLDAAAWRYFGRPAGALSWAEAATLAVLPNAPALIHPGRNRELLKDKRDRLLEKLYDADEIDSLTYVLSLEEPLPGEPLPLPQLAPHLLDRVHYLQGEEVVRTTIDRNLQERVTEILERYSAKYAENGVHNAAALVLSAESGEVLAYVGNVRGSGHGNQVDVIQSLRSPGSLLKPVLFAAMQEEGSLLPATLLPDVPTIIAGYSPRNYNRSYEGAVPAKKALEKSLNVPAVRMLQQYKYQRFYDLLKKLGINSLTRPADHYGLSLILGGAEMSLWDICGMYASMARILDHYYPYDGVYDEKDVHPPTYTYHDEKEHEKLSIIPHPPLSAAAIYIAFQSLLEVNRPSNETGWEYFYSSRQIAWKTGTSFGFRDGWAIGTTPEYVVGVWVGNGDGEGRPGLVGVSTAAPVLFEIYDILPRTGWFDQPYDEMLWAGVCRNSGYLASELCPEVDSTWIHSSGMKTKPCPYHKLIHTDKAENYRVSLDCCAPGDILTQSWFILPPVMEWYYKMKDPAYKVLPPFKEGCLPAGDIEMLEFIYPENHSTIYVPVELDGSPGNAVFEIAVRNPALKVYWHLDDQFLGTTRDIHQLALRPGKGEHLLKVIDEKGNESRVSFRVENEVK